MKLGRATVAEGLKYKGNCMSFFLFRDKNQSGPYTMDELRALAKEQRLAHSDLLWREGWDGWRPVSTVPGVVTPELPVELSRAVSAERKTVRDTSANDDPEIWIKRRVRELGSKTPGGSPPPIQQLAATDNVADPGKSDDRITNLKADLNSAGRKRIPPETDDIGLHLFIPRGRIGRVRWVVRSLIFIILCLIPLVGLVCWYLFVISAIKRVHDFNFRGWWLLLFVPLAFVLSTLWVDEPKNASQNVIGMFLLVTLLLAFIPGTPGENRFGVAPIQPNGKGKRLYG